MNLKSYGIKYIQQSIGLFLILFYLLSIEINCLYNLTVLTTSGNRHTGIIQAFKINSNYTKIYTVGAGAQIKIWNFTYSSLSLIQTISTLDGSITWWNS